MYNQESVMTIKGIGEKIAALFQKLDIQTVEDLVYHFPRDYELMPQKSTLRGFTGKAGAKAAIEATIKSAVSVRRFKGRSMISFPVLVVQCQVELPVG